MLEQVFKRKFFPSPLIIESPEHPKWIELMSSYVLCETYESCGNCRSCRMRKSGHHPDWIQVEGSIKVEDLRDKLMELRRKAFQAAYRMMSFVNFEKANPYVQNALLKVLEEPNENWILVLGLHSTSSLLSTIRSRCLLYRISSQNSKLVLSESIENIFRAVQNENDLLVFSDLENTFKSREEAKNLWKDLLEKASHQKYPGFWIRFAPFLEEALIQLDRNLHPKILWEHAWTKAYYEAH